MQQERELVSSANLPPETAMARLGRNLRDLPGALVLSAWVSGLVAVLIAYTGPLVLVFQAANNGGLDHAHLSSWIWALTGGCGTCGLLLSIWYRQPIAAAWSIAGSALLVTNLKSYTLNEAVGAYIVAGIATVIIGWSGLFRKVLALVPQPVVMGMLVGVLFNFGTSLFPALRDKPQIVLTMLVVFLLLRRINFRAPTVGALLAGFVIAALTGDLHFQNLTPELAVPQFIWPEFTLSSMVSLGLPLFVLAQASQNAPGFAVLVSAGYKTPVDGPIILTGFGSIITAFFGGHGLNLAALMAAICASPEAHPDMDKRYGAGVTASLWFILFGSFGATAVALFSGLPKELIAAVAGLAMAGPILSALAGSMADINHREGAMFAMLLTASGVTLLGIGAPFWGLLIGVAVTRLLATTPR